MRVYAVKGRSKPSIIILFSMTLIQFVYGVVYITIFKREAFTYVPLVSPKTYTFAMCLPGLHETDLQLGYLGLSLGFDVVAFLMVALYSYKSAHIFKPSGLVGRVVQDATIYFLVIVWVHLTITIYTSLMGDSRILRLFPTITNTIIPVMICRLLLSLRKATDPSVVRAWNVDHFSTQIETLTDSYRGSDGVFLSPVHFQRTTVTAASSGRGSEEGGLITPGFRGSLVERGWSIDASEENGPQDTIVRTM